MIQTTFPTLLHWLFPLAVTLHNLEEALWLPQWSRTANLRIQPKVEEKPFRFAVVVLTAAAYALAIWASLSKPGSLAHYLLAAYAFAQSLNILMPHLVATLLSRSYMPGLASGILLVWPAAALYLSASFRADLLTWPTFLLTALIVIPSLLASLPLLFKIGAALFKTE